MASNIQFAQVLTTLMEERYRRNRSALAEAAHVSPSALSQYARGRATPSLEVLAELASALDVSLDMLVFGQERSAPAPEVGYLAGRLEAGLRRAQADAASLHDLVARIGAGVGDRVLSVATEMLPDMGGVGGSLTESDAVVLERCSDFTSIVTVDLDTEVVIVGTESGEEAGAPGLFAPVVASNISDGGKYEYFVPQGASWVRSARLLKEEVARVGDLDTRHVEKNLSVLHVPHACVPGFVLYSVSLERLTRQAGVIVERVRPFFHPDATDPSRGQIGTVAPVSDSYQYYGLVDSANVPRLIHELKDLRRSASRRDGGSNG